MTSDAGDVILNHMQLEIAQIAHACNSFGAAQGPLHSVEKL